MKNIPFDGARGDRQVQLRRMKKIITHALTPLQQQVLMDYYFYQQTIPQIARSRGVQKSTVCRTLHRAEARLRQYLQF